MRGLINDSDAAEMYPGEVLLVSFPVSRCQNTALWSVCVCVCVCVCGHVYVVYEDTNLYNDMGMTQVLQGEGDL